MPITDSSEIVPRQSSPGARSLTPSAEGRLPSGVTATGLARRGSVGRQTEGWGGQPTFTVCVNIAYRVRASCACLARTLAAGRFAKAARCIAGAVAGWHEVTYSCMPALSEDRQLGRRSSTDFQKWGPTSLPAFRCGRRSRRGAGLTIESEIADAGGMHRRGMVQAPCRR